MSNIDWLIVILAFIGCASIAGVIGVVLLIRYIIRDVDDVDGLPAPGPPYVETTIIRPNPERAMARAAAEAGYITNAEYLDIAAKSDALASELAMFAQSKFQVPRQSSPAGAGLHSVESA